MFLSIEGCFGNVAWPAYRFYDENCLFFLSIGTKRSLATHGIKIDRFAFHFILLHFGGIMNKVELEAKTAEGAELITALQPIIPGKRIRQQI